MKNKFYRERAWIRSKYKKGVSKSDLMNSVGIFSNKKKERVMAQKNLSEKEYNRRYTFLANVYHLLTGE